jgi:hypothetical protein
MFVPVKHSLSKRDVAFILKLTVIKNARAGSICSLWIYRSATFINHFTLCHPGAPGFGSDPGVLLLEKF